MTSGACRRRPRRRRALLAVARALAGGALIAAGCAAPEPTFDRVVLVTFDTTRADHLGAYGYPRATSPFFDALAARGVLFERAYAAIPTTVPSHASLFTSLYPLELGVGHNGQRLPRDVPTVAELFRDAGFATAGFVSLGLLRRSGLQRGFDEVEFQGGGGRDDDEPAERDAGETTAAAIAWLRRQPAGSRFFLWVHYYDPHSPYAPPAATRAALRADSGELAGIAELLLGRQGIRLGAFGGDRSRMLDLVDRYDGELRSVDDKLRQLYGAFDELGLAAGSVWVVTGDHGEGLGSHDWLEHGVRIHQEQMLVPLLLHAPGAAWRARRVDAVVELVDLLPTLAAFAGRAPPAGVRGRSLLPYLAGAAEPAEREALVQRRTFSGARPRAAAPPPAFGEFWEDGERLALVGRRWKYIHWTAGPPELFDLEADPTESRNLAPALPERVAQMRGRLLARVRELRALRRSAESADERTLEVLRSLGYLQ